MHTSCITQRACFCFRFGPIWFVLPAAENPTLWRSKRLRQPCLFSTKRSHSTRAYSLLSRIETTRTRLTKLRAAHCVSIGATNLVKIKLVNEIIQPCIFVWHGPRQSRSTVHMAVQATAGHTRRFGGCLFGFARALRRLDITSTAATVSNNSESRVQLLFQWKHLCIRFADGKGLDMRWRGPHADDRILDPILADLGRLEELVLAVIRQKRDNRFTF